MATITSTYTENWQSTMRSTWHLTYTGGGNYTVGESNGLTLTAPSLSLYYTYAGDKTLGAADVTVAVKPINSSSDTFTQHDLFRYKKPATSSEWGKMSPGTTYGAGTYQIAGSRTYSTSDIFNSSNSTKRTLNIGFMENTIYLASTNADHSNENGIRAAATTSTPWKTLGTVTLNAPPVPGGTMSTSGALYKGACTISVDASGTAKYGGSITNYKLTVGSKSVSSSSAGVLSILMDIVGSWKPTLTVTDSRGQTKSKEFSAVTIADNTCSISDLSTSRIDSTTFAQKDDGTNAVLSMVVQYPSFSGNYINEPQHIYIDDGNGAVDIGSSITWYENWDPSDGFDNPISWSNYSPGNNSTIYGKITSNLDPDTAYKITANISTPYATASSMDIYVPTAFYLLSGKAGGHGLGIGMKPPTDDLYLGMKTFVKDASNNMVPLLDLFYPVGSYYETSDTQFNPNDAWGGKWVEDTAGRMLVASGTQDGKTYTVGGTGGDKDAIIPYHQHGVGTLETNTTNSGHNHPVDTKYNLVRVTALTSGGTQIINLSGSGSQSAQGATSVTTRASSGTHTHNVTGATAYAGTNGNTSDANMPPYTVVKRWHRTE